MVDAIAIACMMLICFALGVQVGRHLFPKVYLIYLAQHTSGVPMAPKVSDLYPKREGNA